MKFALRAVGLFAVGLVFYLAFGGETPNDAAQQMIEAARKAWP